MRGPDKATDTANWLERISGTGPLVVLDPHGGELWRFRL